MGGLLAALSLIASPQGMAVFDFVAKTGAKGVEFLTDLSASSLSDEEKLARWSKAIDAFDKGVDDWHKA